MRVKSIMNLAGIIVAGDFNGRHGNWGDKKDNQQGKKLVDLVENLKLNVWSKYVGNSFQCSEGGSRIDLVLSDLDVAITQEIDDETELFTGAPQRGHVPIWTMMPIFTRYNDFQKLCFDWDNTNWSEFEYVMDQKTLSVFSEISTESDPFKIWELAKSILLFAREVSVPLKRITKHSKPYWSPKLTLLSNKLRIARSNFKYRSSFSNGELLKIARCDFTTALEEAKNTYVEDQAKKLNNTDGEIFWRNFKSTFYCRSESNHIGTLNYNSQTIVSDADKASVFKTEIFDGKHLENCNFDNTWYQHVESEVGSVEFFSSDDMNCEYNENIKAEEVHEAIRRVKSSKRSLDTDGIHPKMLKFCGQQFQVVLLILFKSAFAKGIWPWQQGNVTLLKKPGKKKYNEIGSYRPITITSYIGKLFESILKKRLHKFLEDNKILSENQHGFRPHYSTATYMLELISNIQDKIKTSTFSVGLFIDLQKAFDSVWVNGLVFKLKEIGIKGSMLAIIHHFLNNRSIQIRVNDTVGVNSLCKIGVPQGSVLSPTLFAIYINDMLMSLPQYASSYQYADDTSILVKGENHVVLSENCQEVCDKISNWLRKWRLKANCTKSDLLLFYGSVDNPILSGEQILRQDHTKVLGITIDEKLSFDVHLANCQNTLQQKWNLLKPFIYRGLNVQTAKFILQQVVMTKTHYLGFIWDLKLKLSINQIVKSISRAPFNPASEHLFAITDILPLDLFYTKQRLCLIKSLVKVDKINILMMFQKSPIMAIFRSDLCKFKGCRDVKECCGSSVSEFTKSKVRKYIYTLRKTKYMNFCRSNPCSGLLGDLDICEKIVDSNRISLLIKPDVFGSICGLLTGHCRLQEHLYKLKLTFTPCCICLREDESPYHYLFSCPLHAHSRALYNPVGYNWENIAQFVSHSGRKP